MAAYIFLSLSEEAVNVAANCSNVRAKLYYVGNGVSWSNYNCGWSININGNVASGGHSFAKSGTQYLGEHVVTVGHNADGSKSVSASASFATGVSIGTLTTSASINLTKIPRKSTLASVTPSSVAYGDKVTFSISRAASFKHTLQIYYGDAWHDIGTNIETSFEWTPAKSLATAFQTSPATVNVRLITFDGTTNLGSNDYSSALSLTATADMVPALSIGIADTAGYLTKYGGLVQGKSIVKATLTETLSYSAPIKSKNIQIGNEFFSASPATASGPVSGTSLTVKASITDSRGMTGAASSTPTVYPYAAPKATATVARCNSAGTAADNGTYAKVTYSIETASIGGKNSHSAKIMWKALTATTWSSVTLSMTSEKLSGSTVIGAGALATGTTYEAKVVVTDDFGTVESAVMTIPTEFSLINWNNEGMAIGKKSEKNRALEIADGFPLYTGSTRLSLTSSESSTLKTALGASGTSLYEILTAQKNKSDIRTYTNVTLDLTKAVSDTTYAKYPYHVDLTLSGCTANHVPDVYLSEETDVLSGICVTYAGYLRFYATKNTGTITIPTIQLTR